jgi:GAF domain-containing protein
VLNADPALDLGHVAGALDPPLRSSLTVPLAHDGHVVGVLSCYTGTYQGFTEDHLRLLELLAASLAAAVASVGAGHAAAMPRAEAGPRRANLLVMRR